MSEYKKITTPTLTRFVLETMTAGATGSANIATSMGTIGKTIKRQQEAKDDKVPQKPRQGPLRPQTGAGAHKDKKKAQKQGKEKHRKPFYEQHTDHEVEMAQSDTYQLAKQAAELHKILMRASEEQGLEGWQQAKITKAADYINAVYKNLNHDVDMDGHIGEQALSELEKPSGTLYIILLRDRTESVRVVGDFGTFPAEVQARASKVGIKDKEGRKERPLKVNFLMTSASQALAELDKALADVDFIGGEKAEFVFKNSAFETDIEAEVKELQDLISSGADERFKNYEEPEVGSEPETKPKGVDHFVVGPDGKRRRVPIPGKPSSQMGGHAVEQPKTFTYQLKKTELGPKLRSMGFKVDGSQIVLSKQQRDQLLAKMGDQQFGQIFGQGGKFTEGGYDDQFSLGGRLERDDDFRNRERNAGVEHERNNYQVSINGRPWKVFADQRQAMNIARSLKMKGKEVEVYPTGARPSESVEEAVKKPNATTRHLRDYPVSDKDVAKPVKKPEKKKPEQGVAEEKQKGVDGKACWKGYKRMGTKKKGGRTVDNCVKVGEDAYSESLMNQLNSIISEKAPPGDKYERMVKHIKKGYAKDGKISDKERSIAYATAWKAKNKAKK